MYVGARHAADDRLARALRPSSGLPVLASTFAAIAFQIGSSSFYASSVAARHQRRTEARALFAAGDAGADEAQALCRAAPFRGGWCRSRARCRRR